jgi:ABC-type sugar transport system permease subunit
MDAATSLVLADLVLAAHTLFAALVVLGLAAVVTGGVRGWGWVRNPWFRACHLAAIALVAVESWCGVECPLTTLENLLRARAGEAGYAEGFFAHWLGRLLYHEAPPWVFTAAYTLFGIAVAATWRWIPPAPFRSSRTRVPVGTPAP